MGKSDPYVRVLLSGILKARTVTFKNNLNPEWDEVAYVPMHSPREKLTLEVMDEENLGKDRTLGMVELSASDYIKEGPNGEYEVDDEKQLMTSGLRIGNRGQEKGTLNYTVAFYPTLNVVDPEDEEEEADTQRAMEGGASTDGPRKSVEGSSQQGTEDGSRLIHDAKMNGDSSADAVPSKQEANGDVQNGESSPVVSEKVIPKIRITAQDVHKYGMGSPDWAWIMSRLLLIC
jgi:Ca2+-dependent lipid-binding protein